MENPSEAVSERFRQFKGKKTQQQQQKSTHLAGFASHLTSDNDMHKFFGNMRDPADAVCADCERIWDDARKSGGENENY